MNYVPHRFLVYVDHQHVGSVVTNGDLTRKFGTIEKKNALMTHDRFQIDNKFSLQTLLFANGMTKLCSDWKLQCVIINYTLYWKSIATVSAASQIP